MIDRIKFKIIDFDVDLLEKHIELSPVKVNKKTEAFILGATIKNIQFTVSSSRYLTISGSLHKFWKGDNFSFFTFEEAQLALAEISTTCGIPLENFIVTSIEIGINIKMKHDPKTYLNIIKSFKGLPFIPMTPLSKTSQIRGVRCKLSEYDLKFYDKTFETIRSEKIKVKDRVKIPSNLLRFEVAFSGKQLKTIGFHNMTGRSLQHPHHGAMLKRKLKLIFNGIKTFDASLDYSKMLENDVKKYIFAMSNDYNLFLEYLKKYIGEEALRKEIRQTRTFLGKIEPLKRSELEIELKEKFAAVLSKV